MNFYPKFHCELNVIKQYWAAIKWWYHSSPKTTDTVGKKPAPMFVHFGKIGMVRNNDMSKKSEKLHNILQHVDYLKL